MSALEDKGFSLTNIRTASEGVDMNNVDRLRETQQGNGVAIPFGPGRVEGRYASVMTG